MEWPLLAYQESKAPPKGIYHPGGALTEMGLTCLSPWPPDNLLWMSFSLPLNDEMSLRIGIF